ncbi:HNH endonuclease [Acinetobacter colistiniresistens]|uniref:HNH endonuclease n=2 Tax=Acinetobacter colistiniresistens TaxID=280145 RepID=A0A558FLA7_9GAMM|nr:HNH endonuclease [Acinetobacter colistiniresistens]
MDRDEVWKKHEADIAKAERVKDRANKKGFKDKVWKAARAEYLTECPVCEECARRGHVSVALAVIHKINPMSDRVLFWDKRNWFAVCGPCHVRLTNNESIAVLEPIGAKANLYVVED